MQDSPDAARLLGAVADTLEAEILAATDPSVRHEVRVAANLCRIVQREMALEGEADRNAEGRLAALLGHGGSSRRLWAELAGELEAGAFADAGEEGAVHAAVLAIVADKLAVAKPGYDSYDFAAERS
ncbi:MAG: DUF6285 domain-containing protein [Acidimicrobiales bacterium]